MAPSPYIYWQYPGKEINRILGADNYEIKDSRPMFEYEGRKRYFIHAKAIIEQDIPPRGDYQGRHYKKGDIIECFTTGSYDAPIWDVTPDFKDQNVHWNITSTPAFSGNSTSGYCQKKIYRVIPITRKEGTYGGAVIHGLAESYRQPIIAKGLDPETGKIGFFDWRIVLDQKSTAKACIEELPWDCDFKIFADGKVIYHRIENVCPTVWQPNTECPPGTCPVECGSQICCYDHNGIAVTSIPK